MSRDDRETPRVRIRVKERIGAGEAPPGSRSGSPEKIVLVIVGACLGLGIGYLLAGKLVGLLRPPLAAVKAVDKDARRPAGGGPTPAAGAMEFDLPAEGE